jgi:hypothetical protein
MVALETGSPGYILKTGLTISRSGTVLTTAGPDKALFLAHPDLFKPMLTVNTNVSGYELSDVIFDGNLPNRNRADECSGYRYFGFNLQLRGTNFLIRHIDSIRAMCGTAAEVAGSNFTIRNSYFADNGRSKAEAQAVIEPWADGITLLKCDRGLVHNNDLKDNTDIDIVVGGGFGCFISDNTISHTTKHAFAGLHIGWFREGGGNHEGGVYSGNIIASELDQLAFGIIVGYHPWDVNQQVPNAGSVLDNAATGAVVNLAVDGIQAGEILRNSVSDARGTPGFFCDRSAEYTAAHFGEASLQPGWVERFYHNNQCAP